LIRLRILLLLLPVLLVLEELLEELLDRLLVLLREVRGLDLSSNPFLLWDLLEG
jgi:hypothetical protein